MNIALPLFGTRISPHFDYARTALLVIVEGARIIQSNEVLMGDCNPIQRVLFFKNAGVDTIICGGVSEVAERLLNEHNINVIPWISGEAQDALKLFLKGRLCAGAMLCPGRKGRWRFCLRQSKAKGNAQTKERR